MPAYTQFNIGIAREFLLPDDPMPMTVRFDIINLFDTVYFIRDGSGIGMFAPQYGPRRGFFASVSKKFGDTSAASAAYLPGQALAPVYKAPPAVYNWTGPYIGGNIGAAWQGLSGTSFSDTLGSTFTAPTNVQFISGGQVGVNYQFWDGVVIGAEVLFDWLPARRTRRSRRPLPMALPPS